MPSSKIVVLGLLLIAIILVLVISTSRNSPIKPSASQLVSSGKDLVSNIVKDTKMKFKSDAERNLEFIANKLMSTESRSLDVSQKTYEGYTWVWACQEMMKRWLSYGANKSDQKLCNHEYALQQHIITNVSPLCQDNPDLIYVDVGSNCGFFSLLVMAAGCKSISIDPQIECLELLEMSVILSNFTELNERHNVAVSSNPGKFSMHAGSCDGKRSIGGGSVEIEAVSLPDLLGDVEIEFMKIDVEGAELSVVRSAMPFLKNKKVKHFVVEFTPRFWTDILTNGESPVKIMQDIYEAGYHADMRLSPEVIREDKSDRYDGVAIKRSLTQMIEFMEAGKRNEWREVDVLFIRDDLQF